MSGHAQAAAGAWGRKADQQLLVSRRCRRTQEAQIRQHCARLASLFLPDHTACERKLALAQPAQLPMPKHQPLPHRRRELSTRSVSSCTPQACGRSSRAPSPPSCREGVRAGAGGCEKQMPTAKTAGWPCAHAARPCGLQLAPTSGSAASKPRRVSWAEYSVVGAGRPVCRLTSSTAHTG